jgi:predicted DNA-binding transcriptional regulator YafY
MLYKQSFEIERRLNVALQLIRSGRFSTQGLADELQVSIPTVSRIVLALRQRGHAIEAEKTEKGWRYLLRPNRTQERTSRRAGTIRKAAV